MNRMNEPPSSALRFLAVCLAFLDTSFFVSFASAFQAFSRTVPWRGYGASERRPMTRSTGSPSSSSALITDLGSSGSYPLISVSAWRQLAGFPSPPPSTLVSHEGDDSDEGKLEEIRRIQRRARDVAEKYMKPPQARPVQIEASNRSRSHAVHLKQPLVTDIFSIPAVTTRRSRRSAGSVRDRKMMKQELHSKPTGMRVGMDRPSASSEIDLSRQPLALPSINHSTKSAGAEETLPSHSPVFEREIDNRSIDASERAVTQLMSSSSEPLSDPATVSPTAELSVEDDTTSSPAPLASSHLPLTPGAPSTNSDVREPVLSERVRRLRQQPKSAMMEAQLAARYAAIRDTGERAYQILCDLEMIVPAPNPYAPDYDSSLDDELAFENNYLRQPL